MAVTVEKAVEIFDAPEDNGCACVPDKTKILGALLKVQKVIGSVTTDATNPHFKNKYATLEACLNLAKPHLSDAGVVLTFLPNVHGLVTRLWHAASGQDIASFIPIPPQDNPQKYIACLTYYRRTALTSMLGIPQEDDDGNTAAAARPAPRGNAPEKSPATRGGVSVAEIKKLEARLEAATLQQLLDNKGAIENLVDTWGAEGDKILQYREKLIRKKRVDH